MAAVAVGALLLAPTPTAGAKAPPSYVLTGQFCKANYVGKWVKVRKHVHHRIVIVKRAECVRVPRPTVTFYWCNSSPTSPRPSFACSTDASMKGNPPNPFKTNLGRQVYLDASVFGSLRSDTLPSGWLTYNISGPAGASYTATWFDTTQQATIQGCQRVIADDGSAGGSPCDITFNSPGTYRVALSFTDTDRTYRNAQGPVEMIQVS
jgi:hypothetical protein